MGSSIIDRQQVSKRRKFQALKGFRTHDGSGDSFVQGIRQKPVRLRRRRAPFRLPQSGFSFSLPQWFKSRSAGRRAENAGIRTESQGRAKSSGFSFRVPSLANLAVIAGTLVVSLFALNWEGLGLSPRISLEPGPDEEVQRNLAFYAGLALPETPAPAEGDIPLDLMETFAWDSYTVRRGDSVSKIASEHGIPMDAVIASNSIRNARRLREGEVLRIPNMDGIPYEVKKGDSLSKISKSMGVPLEAILDANDLRSDTITRGQQLFIPGAKMRSEDLRLALGELAVYPIRGRLTSGFGWRSDPINGARRYHAAIDLAAAIGTPVKAAMDGKVAAAGNNATYGKFIILSHDGGYQSMYAHLSVISVNQGDRVSQGNKIGEVGNTGYSTGPHLHFAMYKNGRAVNPLDLLH